MYAKLTPMRMFKSYIVSKIYILFLFNLNIQRENKMILFDINTISIIFVEINILSKFFHYIDYLDKIFHFNVFLNELKLFFNILFYCS